MKEIDLAAHVIAYLRDLQYEVHQEVNGADIVAVMGRHAWIIECKMAMGFPVIAQAYKWIQLGAAPFVSIATPCTRGGDGERMARRFLQHLGIGWLTVSDYVTADNARWEGDYPVRQELAPRVHRWKAQRFAHDIRDALNEHTLSGYAVAGSPSPRRWTPFKQFAQDVRAALKHSAGPLTVREIIAKLPTHHYASDSGARSRLAHFLGNGIIEGIARVDGEPTRWTVAA